MTAGPPEARYPPEARQLPDVLRPTTIDEVCSMTRRAICILPRGGGTKSALSTPPPGAGVIELSRLAGVLEYQPGEFTFTALAGTRLSDVNDALAEHQQYLPFDPLLVERGATLGGTVAANTCGPGRYHYGGVRDFITGVRFVNSDGKLVRGGGKVVKNAAGFDLPKLMVGSLGSFGVLVEVSFKVFPKPEAYATLRLDCPDVNQALQAMQRIAAARLEVDALDLEPLSLPGDAGGAYLVWARIAGREMALEKRLERLHGLFDEGVSIDLPAEQTVQPCIMRGEEEEQIWRDARELAWVPVDWSVIKVPLTPGRILGLETALGDKPIMRRYSSGGQMAWLALEGSPKSVEGLLASHGLTGVVLFGYSESPRLGEGTGKAFYRRVKDALDPARHFVEV
jgi:glycolate oxidase FAD binding subunit